MKRNKRGRCIGIWSDASRAVEDYRGPTLRLRRASDNQERDWAPQSGGLIDYPGLLQWAGESDLFVVIRYNQLPGGVHKTEGPQPRLDLDELGRWWKRLQTHPIRAMTKEQVKSILKGERA